eukprot:COSAG01_NODE_8381_length_2806_cov_28.911532_6_plen_72_part_00
MGGPVSQIQSKSRASRAASLCHCVPSSDRGLRPAGASLPCQQQKTVATDVTARRTQPLRLLLLLLRLLLLT